MEANKERTPSQFVIHFQLLVIMPAYAPIPEGTYYAWNHAGIIR